MTALASCRRSPPSTLYTCRRRVLRVGLARRCRGQRPGDSPTLTGSGQAVSEPAAQLLKSAASTSFATGALVASLPIPLRSATLCMAVTAAPRDSAVLAAADAFPYHSLLRGAIRRGRSRPDLQKCDNLLRIKQKFPSLQPTWAPLRPRAADE
jgi:hypothetical protein